MHRALKGIFFAILIFPGATLLAQNRDEEKVDYFKKWLTEDVVYIITAEEKKVFENLTTPAEKEAFIEQFWRRRDPDPRTSENEFKIEHYRRIAYANERFASGKAGWKTDRGRVYIVFGPPTEITSSPGGQYMREYYEGGGDTLVYPFERWRYRYIEGVGPDVEIEFVDRSMTGEYRMSMDPQEKDALLETPGVGDTLDEMRGLTTRIDRMLARTASHNPLTMTQWRAKDRFFDRLQQHVNLQRPPAIQYKDLQKIVETNISYQDLPFRLRQDYFEISESQYLVPVTLELDNQNLSFVPYGSIYQAEVQVYGAIYDLAGRVLSEFEDTVRSTTSVGNIQRHLKSRSVYQKPLILNSGLYKMVLVVKDPKANRIATREERLRIAGGKDQQLSLSSVILAHSIQQLNDLFEEEQFVLGDLKIIPNVARQFPKNTDFSVYFQVYGAGVDQQLNVPSLEVKLSVKAGGNTLREVVLNQYSILYASDRRMVFAKQIPVRDLISGNYQLAVEVRDLISGKRATAEASFEILPHDTL